MRTRTIVMVLSATVALLVFTPGASAQDEPASDTPTTYVAAPPGAVGIGDEIFLTGAVVTPPDGGAPRNLDAYQAAVFVQSWLGQAFIPGPSLLRDPPPDLPVFRVDVSGIWAGTTGIVTVHYTDNGSTPYIAFPGLVVSESVPDPPPPPSNWFVAPTRVIDTFNGKGKLVDTAGTRQATSTTGSDPGEQATPASNGGGTPTRTWILLGVALVALAAAVVRRLRLGRS